MEPPLYPLQLYIFNADGTYGEPIQINSKSHLYGVGVRMVLQNAIRSGVEVRMCDPSDSIVLHAVNGEIIFPTQEQIRDAR